MKISSSHKLVAAVFTLGLMAAGNAQELDTPWHLRVMDLKRHVKVEATIRFTDKPAESCMGGAWKRIVVEESTVKAEDFFPLKDALAYEQRNKRLTLGRTQVCDGYLFLSGPLKGLRIEGSFDSVGWGSKRLGYFVLEKVQ